MDKKVVSPPLQIKKLQVSIEKREIISGVSLTIKPGEFHVVMGPNGSGKSTLTSAIMGHPAYNVSGSVLLNKENLLDLPPEDRAKRGLLLAFQNPIAVPGVTISNFLRTAYRELFQNEKFDALAFHQQLKTSAQELKLDETFLRRAINDGFSGGEKKKLEMLQLLVLKPRFAIFDEIDTGLDVDALKLVANGINKLQNLGCGVLLITHYQRILNYVKPQFVHVLVSGVFVKEGGPEIVHLIEKEGYANIHRS